MYIKRKLEGTILGYLHTPEIIAVVGPRQCGKTTLLRHLYNSLGDKAVFLSFEDRKVLDLFEHNLEEFVSTYIKKYQYVFIDEFQYAKHGGKTLKYIFDLHHTKIIVSGSSVIDLTVKAVKFLVGRIFMFTIYPLDFEEFLSFKDTEYCRLYQSHKVSLTEGGSGKELGPEQAKIFENYFREFVLYGGYPRVVLSKAEGEKQTILENIYNAFFLREVKDILGLIDDYKLTKLVQALAAQVGNLIEYQELSRVSGLSFLTVKKYVNFLQKTFICLFPKPYFRNKRAEIVKNPKVYFLDSGLRNSITSRFGSLDARDDAGALLENASASQFVKQGYPVQFWRTKKQEEIDFVVSLPAGKHLAIEVKKTIRQKVVNDSSTKEFQKLHPKVPLWYAYYYLGNNKILSINNYYPVYLF